MLAVANERLASSKTHSQEEVDERFRNAMRTEYIDAALADLNNITYYYALTFGIESAYNVYEQIRGSFVCLTIILTQVYQPQDESGASILAVDFNFYVVHNIKKFYS